MKKLLALWALLLMSGCESDPLSGKNDPKLLWWQLGFFGPSYMQGEVEFSVVEDIHGKRFNRPMGGYIGNSYSPFHTEPARGWSSKGGPPKGVVGADLPKRIFVRWQSVVESKTYKGWVEIPEEGRQRMRASTERRCAETPEQAALPFAKVSIGMAPGGVMKVMVLDSCYDSYEVARGQAEIEPLGPHLGASGGKYYPLSEESRRYIEQYGIPFGSW